jgi:uncharacterized membrane-anchored protein
VAHARTVRPDSSNPVRATRALAGRVQPGDIVLLDQLDLDRVTAESLAAAEPSAVVNVRASLSGRHPAAGAAVLVGAGITLVDDTGPGLLSAVRDGQVLRVHQGRVYDHERLIGHGDVLTTESVAAAQARARTGMLGKLEAVGSDAVAFLRGHESLLLEGAGLPELDLPFDGRMVLVVGPGDQSAAQARALRGWARENRALVVGAGEGAASAARAGLRVDLIVGDPVGSASPEPGPARLSKRLAHALRIEHDDVPSGLSPADLGILLAADGDARVIVVTGAPVSYDEMLERDRDSAASLLARRCGVRRFPWPEHCWSRRPAWPPWSSRSSPCRAATTCCTSSGRRCRGELPVPPRDARRGADGDRGRRRARRGTAVDHGEPGTGATGNDRDG